MTAHLAHYALNALWQVPLLTLTCALAIRLLRPGLLTSHLLWIATLLLAVVMPCTGFPSPQQLQISRQTAPSGIPSKPLPLPANTPIVTEDRVAPDLPMPSLRLHAVSIAVPHLSPRVLNLLALAYLLASLAALCRLLVSAMQAHRLYQRSTPAILRIRHALIVAQLTDYFGLRQPPIRVANNPATGPMLVGLIDPAILLPAALTQAAPADFATIIAHELSHLRRRDLIVNVALRLAALPIVFHPATVLLHARIRNTRELLTDRLAAGALRSPTAYAQSLLTLSQQLVETQPTPPLAAGLFEQRSRSNQAKHVLEERIMKLIATPVPTPRPYVRAARALTAVALFTCSLAAVSLLHVTPAALAAELASTPLPVVDTPTSIARQTAPPAAPPALTPDEQTPTSPDNARTRTITRTQSTPDTTTRPTNTISRPAEPSTSPTPPATPGTPLVPPPPASTDNAQDGDLARQAQAAAKQDQAAAKQDQAAARQDQLAALQNQAAARQQQAMARMQADMDHLAAQLKTETDANITAQMQATLSRMRKQFDSPEFKRQLQQASDAAANIQLNLPAQELQFHKLDQLNSPEFKQQVQAAQQAQSNPTWFITPRVLTPNTEQREALTQSFRKRLSEARRSFRERLAAAGSDQALINQATNRFTADVQTATDAYTAALTGPPAR